MIWDHTAFYALVHPRIQSTGSDSNNLTRQEFVLSRYALLLSQVTQMTLADSFEWFATAPHFLGLWKISEWNRVVQIQSQRSSKPQDLQVLVATWSLIHAVWGFSETNQQAARNRTYCPNTHQTQTASSILKVAASNTRFYFHWVWRTLPVKWVVALTF